MLINVRPKVWTFLYVFSHVWLEFSLKKEEIFPPKKGKKTAYRLIFINCQELPGRRSGNGYKIG